MLASSLTSVTSTAIELILLAAAALLALYLAGYTGRLANGILLLAASLWTLAKSDLTALFHFGNMDLAQPGQWLLLLNLIALATGLFHILVMQPPPNSDYQARRQRRFTALIPIMTGCAYAAVALGANGNPVGMWLAIEAMTMSAALLVYYSGGEHVLEASWKLFLVSSIAGLAAFAGTGLAIAGGLPRLALLLIVIGFSAKVGLVPGQTWKPAAYRAAQPAAGVMLASMEVLAGFYAIFYWFQRLHGENFFAPLLLLALLTLVVGAVTLLIQDDLQQALAYSTIEQAALVLLALLLAPGLGLAFTLLVTGTVLKALAFYALPLAGRWRWLLVIILLLLAGTPPSPLFFSELSLLGSALARNQLLLGIITLLVLTTFSGLALLIHRTIFPSLLGPDPAVASPSEVGETVARQA